MGLLRQGFKLGAGMTLGYCTVFLGARIANNVVRSVIEQLNYTEEIESEEDTTTEE